MMKKKCKRVVLSPLYPSDDDECVGVLVLALVIINIKRCSRTNRVKGNGHEAGGGRLYVFIEYPWTS